MREEVTSPAGEVWQVTAGRLAWRPRRRRIGDVDPVGIVLAILSLPLLALEWLAALAVSVVRPARRVVAFTDGPPTQRLTWRCDSPSAAQEKATEVLRRLAAGEEVALDADERRVGA